MADDKATAVFMSLPLEVRHAIFEHAAARNVKPKKLLRYWFEKKEVKELISQVVAANPTGPAPRVVHDNDGYESESEPVEEDGDEEGEEEGEDGNEEDADSEEEDDDAQEDEDADGEHDMGQEAEAGDEDADEEAMDGDQHDPSAGLTQVPFPAQIQALSTVHSAHLGNQAEQHDANEEGEEGEAETDNQDIENDVDQDGDSAMADEDDDGDNAPTVPAQVQAQPRPQPPPPPAPVVRAHRKWRHIPKFMRITHYPPPIELLLTSKQLNEEVKNWYYDVAVLRIEATGSFAHTSFFEEAFSQITDAAFSPMENIRKVEVTFVWDTTWIRADKTGCVEAIFPALLRQRSNFVYQILTQAPDLKEVVIHWHDSAQDDESANLRMDILEPFLNLPATVKAVEHYIDPDTKPNSRSIAGRRRVEFQRIVDMGLDRLF